MRKRMANLLFCMAAMMSCAQEDEKQTLFILDSITLVAENGERFVFLEDYADVIKKDIKILREYDELVIDYEFRILDCGSFKILFDLNFKVRNIYIKEPGPRLLNGIGIGDPLESFLEDFQNDPRYAVGIDEEHSYVYLFFPEYRYSKLHKAFKGVSPFGPSISVRYDENRKVDYISAGWVWP